MFDNRYGHLVHEYYVKRVRQVMADRAARLGAIQSQTEAAHYVRDVRTKVKQVFPALPAKTPLKPQITGELDFGDFRIEKIIYESRPNFFVSANLYLPGKLDRNLPCVLGLCGHSANGKAHVPYQSFAQGLARKGFATLIIDPVSQGERRQFYPEDGSERPRSTVAHNMIGNRMALTGDFIGSWFVWDAIRGLDYLLARPEVDPSRVGVTGCSGGGTQTTWLTALDPRITMAAPDCYITSWLYNLENELPIDAEQCPPQVLALGLDQVDFLLAYAPRPTLILAEENCFFDLRGAKHAFLEMQRIHHLLDSPESAEISIGPKDHGFHQHAREAMYRFFIKQAGLTANWQEPALTDIAEADLNAAQGEVAKVGSRKIFLYTQDRAKGQKANRPMLNPNDLKDTVCQYLHLTAPTSVPHFRYLRASGGRNLEAQQGYQFAVETESGIQVILTMFGDMENACRLPTGSVSLYVGHHSGQKDCATLPWLQDRIQQGAQILATDLRGMGQSFPATCGSSDILEPYGSDYLYASCATMLGDSYLGQRVLDLWRTVDLLVEAGATVNLIGRGVGAVPVALAALLHPSQPTCEIIHYLPSYQMLVDKPFHNWPLSTFITNCLTAFDLPDIYDALGSRLKKREPWGAVIST